MIAIRKPEHGAASTVDFVHIERGRRAASVRAEWQDALAAALFDGQGCTATTLGGRGTLERFAFEGGNGLIRRCLRGGAIRHVLRDAYLLDNRPLRELRLHAELYDAGLPTVAPLGAVWERRGLFYRGAVATLEVAARNLLEALRDGGGEASEGVLTRCGAVIRQMHELGVYHADLQLRNILVSGHTVYLIDFDKARRVTTLPPLQRARNLLRLKRSFEKNGIDVRHFQVLCAGYGGSSMPSWLERVYRGKGRVSDALAGRS